MARRISAKAFREMAEQYQVEGNALFNSALETYRLQLSVIRNIEKDVKAGNPTTEKEYVKGRKNLYIHPAIKELPRHVDSASKTAALLLSIIKDLGRESDRYEPDEFERF